MPTPVSFTLMQMWLSSLKLLIVILPPWGIASTELLIRLVKTSLNSEALPDVVGRVENSFLMLIFIPLSSASSFLFVLVNSSALSMTSFKSMVVKYLSSSLLRANSWILLTVSAPSLAALSITSRPFFIASTDSLLSFLPGGGSTFILNNWALPRIAARALLKSWATPPASSPKDFNFSDWRSLCSISLLSVISLKIDTPAI